MTMVGDLTKEEFCNGITEAFHTLFYASHAWEATWCGVGIAKAPTDLFIYQLILTECRPEVIIETGTCHGGSALFLAMICDRLRQGQIITIDNDVKPGRPVHPRIHYLHGSSTDTKIVGMIKTLCAGKTVMALLDSDHSKSHVEQELLLYAPLVTPGQFLVVEDTNLNGHPVWTTLGPGPWEALQEWLPDHPEFRVQDGCGYLGLTFNPRGYLIKT